MLRSCWIASCLLISVAALSAEPHKQPVDYVNPNIGSIGILLTSTEPYVQYPYGMARVVPVYPPGTADGYLANTIYGFSAGPAILMATTRSAGAGPVGYASHFDPDFVTATPYYYSMFLEDTRIKAELTVAQRCSFYRFSFPRSSPERITLSLGKDSNLEVVSPTEIEGSQEIGALVKYGSRSDTKEYFVAEFDRPFHRYETWSGSSLSEAPDRSGNDIGSVSGDFAGSGGPIEVRVGVSYISLDQARWNLQSEIPSWSFKGAKAEARRVWNRALSRIAITGATEHERTIFYTALYRSLLRMTDITEDGRYFSGFDGKIHLADGHDFYVDDGIWDTFRCMHPLQLLLNPARQEDMIRSYLRMYRQSGWLPSFPQVTGAQALMIGHHATALITDTYMKGYRDFDVEEAYTAMKKNALEATMLPWTGGPLTQLGRVYFEKGFFPALAKGEKEWEPEVNLYERRQAVSVTLDTSYDDWCLAQMAAALGKKKDYAYFIKLAHNYMNVFNPRIGFMAPRSADGNWVADFNPTLGGGQGGRDYFTEMNSWIYTFDVQQDPAGLIRLMGGRKAFNAELDELFVEPRVFPNTSFSINSRMRPE